MLPAAQTLFRRCFQRRVHIRSFIIRRNSFCPPPEQLTLFPRHDSDEPPAKSGLHRLALILNRLHDRLRMKTLQ